jgi:hypothetical protein
MTKICPKFHPVDLFENLSEISSGKFVRNEDPLTCTHLVLDRLRGFRVLLVVEDERELLLGELEARVPRLQHALVRLAHLLAERMLRQGG